MARSAATLKDELARIQLHNSNATASNKKLYTQRSSLTLAEKLDLPIALLSLPIAGFLALLTGPFRARKQRLNPKQSIAKNLLLHVGYAVLRRFVARFSPLQAQVIIPSTPLNYKLFVWRNGLRNQTVDLGQGATGHWLGDPNAKNVLIWIHGGGWAVPANRGYFTFFGKFLKEMHAAGKDISIFAVAYTLAPKAVYPTQLRQSVSAVRYILEQPSRTASNVYLGGDSAGGNLVLGVLSHIAHTHPEIEALKLSAADGDGAGTKSQFGGITLVAPWSSLETSFPPLETENLADLIDPGVAEPWAGSYLGGRERDNYTDPRLAPAEWLRDFPVKHVLITAGGSEVLLPFIEDFANRMKEALGEGRVEYFVGAGEAHVAPMFNLLLGDSTETEQGKKIMSFHREMVGNE